MRPAIFLDRDGTLNVRPPVHEYVRSVDQFVWLPRVPEAAARLAARGYVLTVVSNQRGVARGLVSYEALRAIEQVIQSALSSFGARIEAFRYCPHELDANCDCRKPRPGLLESLSSELGLDLGRSWMIGDADSDVLAGRAAGCHTARIDAQPTTVDADIHGASLLEVGERIVAATTPPTPPLRTP